MVRFQGKMNWFSCDQIIKIEPGLGSLLKDFKDEYIKDISLILIAHLQKQGFVFFDSEYHFNKEDEFLEDGIHYCRYSDPSTEVRYRNVKGVKRVIEIGINFRHIV